MSIKTYKYKLYRAKRNKHLLRQIDVAGLIYNHAIALHRYYYRLSGKHLNQYALMRHLAKLRNRADHAHWRIVGSQAVQDIAQRIERAYTLFFRNLKAGVKTAPPGFKKVKRYSSFTLKQTGWKLLVGNRIVIQGRVYKYSKSRELPPEVKTLTVKRDALGALWLYFVVKTADQRDQAMTGNSAGFDFGLKTFLTVDDGQVIESPLYYQQALPELRLAQRAQSRKVKFSHNWHKAKAVVVRRYQRVVYRRCDWCFKLAHRLTAQYDYLFFEDLNMKGMQRRWGRKVGDLARSEFMGILNYVASGNGKVVHLIDRFYSSSKTCSACGQVYAELTLAERRWACPGCGVVHERDVNAAVNIRRVGASTLRLGEVSPEPSGVCCSTLESYRL